MSQLARRLSLVFPIVLGCYLAVPSARAQAQETTDANKPAGAETRPTTETKVRKSEDEWRRILTPSQFLVTRLKETEAPFTGKYSRGHFKGTFVCVCCGAELFSSKTKFESGTGWPSFWQPTRKDAIATQWDYSEAEPRVEVMCRRCDAHLGHVFDDGPAPTGLRYCINSGSLKLKLEDAKSVSTKTKTKAKAKSQTKRVTSSDESP